MLKRVSLRWRLTILTSVLIAVCCIGLSIVLNITAYQMADHIDAYTIQPALSVSNQPMENLYPSSSVAVIEQEKQVYMRNSFIYTCLAVGIGGMFTYYVAGKALEPLQALNEQVKHVHLHNLEESLVVPKTQDELAELTQSFNKMMEQLSQSFSLQKNFSANAAHELRTPLAVLQTKLDVFAKKTEHSLEEYDVLIEVVQKQVTRLRKLIQELLSIANMEDEINLQEIDLSLVLHEVQKELSDVAKQYEVQIRLIGDNLKMRADESLLYRAVYNLVENAIKYNVKNGEVVVNWYQCGEQILIEVRDTGSGIADEYKKQVFEPFYRIDKSRSRQMGGAGLGLSLVDMIIKRHHGTIVIFDNEEQGTCFRVRLPQ